MADLERTLRTLAERDDLFPPTPDFTSNLATQLEYPAKQRRSGWRPIAILAALLLVTLTVALAVPSTRAAIVEFLGLAGIRIEITDDARERESGTPHPLGKSLLLGEQTTLPAVQALAPFPVQVPDALLTPPNEVYFSARTHLTVAALLWHSRPDLPEIGETGVGLLLLEIAAKDDHILYAKKVAGAGQIDTVRLNGRSAYWIEGGVLVVEPVEGLMLNALDPAARLSGNVLLWSDGAVTYRLETALPRADALRLAASLRPAADLGNP